MELLTGLYQAVALLLLGAGVAKLRRPGSTSASLAALRLPARRPVAVAIGLALGLAEVGLAGSVLMGAGRAAAAAVAAAYIGFAAFVALAMARGGRAGSCGCFGAADAPPGPGHLAVVLAAAAVAAAAALGGTGAGLPAAFRAGAPGLVLLGLAALCAWLAVLLLTVLPAVTEARPAAVERRAPAPLPTPVRRPSPAVGA
jgi:hypothetical protein